MKQPLKEGRDDIPKFQNFVKNNRIEHVDKINEYVSKVNTSFQGASKNGFIKVVELLKRKKLNLNIVQLKVNYQNIPLFLREILHLNHN